jgi:dTMP kinase
MRGQFITLEGGEGTGKSTLQAALAEKLRENDIEIITTREPGGTPLAEFVRELVLRPPEGESWTPIAEALLMFTAREEHLAKLIRPALARGAWVLCDRFADSSRAYQAVGGRAPAQFIETLDAAIVGETQPDLTLILDADPEQLQTRRQARGDKDIFETRGIKFHRLVRTAFLEIAETYRDRCVVIDALAPASDVLRTALRVIETRFIPRDTTA